VTCLTDIIQGAGEAKTDPLAADLQCCKASAIAALQKVHGSRNEGLKTR
jgi:hypothetical protein